VFEDFKKARRNVNFSSTVNESVTSDGHGWFGWLVGEKFVELRGRGLPYSWCLNPII